MTISRMIRASTKIAISPILFAVWLLGTMGLLGYGILSALRLRQQLRCSLHIRDNIYLADGIATPFVFGLLCPKIYLPPGLGEQEQDYIVLHEQCHIFRRDYLFRPMAFAALCLHWFNPLVWLAFALSGKDMEMSCDEAVMRKAGRDIRSEYARSLLVLTVGKGRMPGVPLAFGESDTKSRIKNVMNYKRPGFVILAVAALACAMGAVCLITNPITSVSEKNSPESGTESADIIFGTKENPFSFSYQQITPEEEKMIREEIIKSNDSGYSEEYDICCCNFVNLKKVAKNLCWNR